MIEKKRPAIASVTPWLTVLFLLNIMMILVGGYVRLTGSGLSLPDWPLVNGSVLPPQSQEEWELVHSQWQDEQKMLQSRIDEGEIGMGSLGHNPGDNLFEFKIIFYIEWAHRFVASLMGIVGLACLVTGLTDKSVRGRIGGYLIGINAGIVFQAVLGGILVISGTKTNFLVLHMFVNCLILSGIMIAILRAIQIERMAAQTDLAIRKVSKLSFIGVILILVQIALGALVAGSLHNTPGMIVEWPLMRDQLIPANMYSTEQSFAFNLLDNTFLLQWVHRWFAWLLVGHLIVVIIKGLKTNGVPDRARIALQMSVSLIVIQIGLGIFNVLGNRSPVMIPLAHLIVAMFILLCYVLVWHDCRQMVAGKETQEQKGSADAPVPA